MNREHLSHPEGEVPKQPLALEQQETDSEKHTQGIPLAERIAQTREYLNQMEWRKKEKIPEQPPECPDELWDILSPDALIAQEWLFEHFNQERSEWGQAGMLDEFDGETKGFYETVIDQSDNLRKMVSFLYGSEEVTAAFSFKDLNDLFEVIDGRYQESRPTIADKLRKEVAVLFQQTDPRVHVGSQSLRRGLNVGKLGHLEKNGIIRGEDAELLQSTVQFAEREAYGIKDMIDTLVFASKNTDMAVRLLSDRIGLSRDTVGGCLLLVLSEMEAEHDAAPQDDDTSKKSWFQKMGKWFMGAEVDQAIPLAEKVQSVLERDDEKWAHRLTSLLAASKQRDIDRRYFKDELYNEKEIRIALLDAMRNDEGPDGFSLDEAGAYADEVIGLSRIDRASGDDLQTHPAKPATVWGRIKARIEGHGGVAITETSVSREKGESMYLISPRMLQEASGTQLLDIFVDAVKKLENYPGDKRNPAYVESAQAVDGLKEKLANEYAEWMDQQEAYTKEQEDKKKESEQSPEKPLDKKDTGEGKKSSGAEWFSVETMMEPVSIAGENVLKFAVDQVRGFVDRMKNRKQEERELRQRMIERIASVGSARDRNDEDSRKKQGPMIRRSSSRVSSPLRSSIR